MEMYKWFMHEYLPSISANVGLELVFAKFSLGVVEWGEWMVDGLVLVLVE